MRWVWLALALASTETRTVPAPEVPVVRDLVFVVVTDPRTPGTFGRTDYEALLERTAATWKRESEGRLELRYRLVELPLGEAGYGARTFLEWYEDLRDSLDTKRWDALAFAPDRPQPWCTDAHSLGVVVEGKAFTCLEAPRPLPLASNLLIHKLFHTYGFFHQHLRNKQLRLLDWQLGLPSYTDDDVEFFSPMALDAIRIGRLRCDQPGDAPEQCRDVVGPSSWDIDRDGIRDDVDGYPVSPPLRGTDSDHDGIPDALDLCPGNEIVVEGVSGGPMNYWANAPFVDLSVTAGGKPLELRWVAASIDTGKRLGDLMYFDASRETIGGRVTLPHGTPVRARVDYDFRGTRVRRTFWIYGESSKTSPGPWAYFDEKEWMLFGRFGCDPPAGFDSYDSPVGSPTVPDAYDWDGDGVPDREDTLPTVAGTCSDAHVRGVKDTDGDGFCDPGALVLDRLPPSTSRASYFGELPTGMGNDPDFDRCPYRPGRDHGCPER